MYRTRETQIFQKIKRTINILSLGRTENKKLSADSLAVINTPALLGKRDALYEKAINTLKCEIFPLPLNERSVKYEQALLSLISGIETGRQIFFYDGFKNKEQHIDNPLDHYMILLADTVQTALTLCNHQIIFKLEKENVRSLLGKDGLEEIKREDTIFFDSEKKIHDCVKILVDSVESSVKNYQNLLKKSMSKEDETRYKKSYSQYLANC